jgi:hypothetical protein
MVEPTTCPIWGTPAERLPTAEDRCEIISMRAGGRYAIAAEAEALLARQPPTEWERIILTGWLVEQRRNGETCPYLSRDVLQAEIGRGGY